MSSCMYVRPKPLYWLLNFLRHLFSWRISCGFGLLVLLLSLVGCGLDPQDLEDSSDHIRPPSLPPAEHFGMLYSAMACGPGTAQEPAPRNFSTAVEAYAKYVGQTKCDPTAKPGVIAFRDLVLKTYPCTGDSGISRSCNVGGTSEHKEGRAWDWRLNYPHPAATAFLNWLLATDSNGNKHAMARRLGVMYIVWNRKIWASYRSTEGWRNYTGASPHTDHVHFSFSWDGANKKTSYWSGSNVPPPTIDAKFISQGQTGGYGPSNGAQFSLCPGQTFQFHFAVQNTGNVTWQDNNQHTIGQAVRLGYRQGERFGNPERISLNQASKKTVKPNEQVTFTMPGTAPTKSGVYKTEWQMVSEMVTWFGPNMWLSFNVTSQPPGYGKACNTGQKGVCSEGLMKCSNGTLSCVANKSPSPEICDGLDNNCNGQIDEGGVCDVTPPKPEPPPPHPEPTAEPPPPHPEPTAEIAALEEIPSPAEQATAEFSDHDGATTADASAATDNALPDYAPLNDDLHSTDNAGTSQTPDDLVGEDLHRVLVIDTHSLNAPIYQPRGCGCQSHQHPSASLPFGLIPIILVLLCVTWRRLLH